MGTYHALVKFDDAYRHCARPPIILNDVDAFSVEDEAALHKLIYTTFSGDMLSNIPACECGTTSGKYNVGITCRACGTQVRPIFESDIQPLTWIRAPKGVKAMINPLIWTMLKDVFEVGNFNIIHWLCDSGYHPATTPPAALIAEVRKIMIAGNPIQQGYNYFITHFDEIIEKLFELKMMKRKQRADKNITTVLRRVLIEFRSRIFSQHIPIPHRSMLVLETDSLMMYVDPLTKDAIDAILLLAGIDTELNAHSQRLRESRTVRTIDMLASVYHMMYKKQFSEKEGDFRKHVFATRSAFSFRAVIASITDKHNYREVYIPWGIATSVFKQHLKSKMIRLGFTPDEASQLIDDHAGRFHPLLSRLFDEIIAEAPNGIGVSATLNRNPSLERGSIQHVYISRVIKEPEIPTVFISILVVKALNADKRLH